MTESEYDLGMQKMEAEEYKAAIKHFTNVIVSGDYLMNFKFPKKFNNHD